MTVKDLVQRYEPSSSHHAEDNSTRSKELPPPRLARFITRPLKEDSQQIHDLNSTLSPSISKSATLTVSEQSNFDSAESRSDSHATLVARSYPKESDDNEVAKSLLQPTYPPERGNTLSRSRFPSNYSQHAPFHRPVPATILFARSAYPLNLPSLDRYLSSIVPPDFSSKGRDCEGAMFPPLDKLENTGITLDDLENNSKIPPAWRDRTSILSTVVSLFTSVLGSSALASFYSVQGLINTLQIFALLLSTVESPISPTVENTWRQVFLGTIPNILALNFAPVVIQSLIFLTAFILFDFLLLFLFYRSTQACQRYNSIEGLQRTETRGKQWGLVIVTFLLMVIYLPLSTMSVHVLVWSDELWAIPNPYTNATSFPPTLPPLGPSNEYRDPLDFCWTTTMKRNEINLAPVFFVLSALVFIFATVWFPIALVRVIRLSVPKVDRFTEIGRPRTSVDKDGEYHRLISRDNNPFAFLYMSFRRGQAAYISNIVIAKLCTLLIIAVIDSDNCLFRNFDQTKVAIARQSLLVAFQLCSLVFHSISVPFADPVNNSSEWTSRLNYVLTSLTALIVALNTPGKEIFDTYVLYGIYVITYGLSFYFVFVNTSWMQRFIKILSSRIDFSIDIFSPRLDISPNSIHTKRRIWQESISALLLTDKGCRIPVKQEMAFAESRNSEYPPYLLDFLGTPGERYVENLKVLRDVGLLTYTRAVALTSGPDAFWHKRLAEKIQEKYIGPDSYWKNLDESTIPGCSNFFGNAWWIPFPPTLVIRYDDGRHAVLNEISELAAYIDQNSSPSIQRKRFVRIAIRALEGRIVRWPYEHVENVGSHMAWCFGRRYDAVTSRTYRRAMLRIKRHGYFEWRGLQLGSGFEVELGYSKNVKVTGEVIGLNEDFDLNSLLARFLELNRDLIERSQSELQEKLSHYRRHYRKESQWKSVVLTYRFMTFIYNHPRVPDECTQSSLQIETDCRVRECIGDNQEVFKLAYDRLMAVSQSEAATWWYIFWDDLWRRNHDSISGLQKYAADFNPHYKTSIAYTPLPRPALETFLTQRGLLHTKPQFFDFFHAGFLNKLYLRLNDTVYRKSKSAIVFHLGNDRREMDMEDIDILTQAASSTLGTGGGTDHDDPWILARPAYRWEALLNDPPRNGGKEPRKTFLAKLGVWFGVTPFWRAGSPSNGISVDLKLEGGRYVLLDHDAGEASGQP